MKRGVAPERLISVHDPEMRHGRKSSSHHFNGHKAQVAVDTDTQLITAVEVFAGNAPDAEQALEVVEASEAATGSQVVCRLVADASGSHADPQRRVFHLRTGRSRHSPIYLRRPRCPSYAPHHSAATTPFSAELLV